MNNDKFVHERYLLTMNVSFIAKERRIVWKAGLLCIFWAVSLQKVKPLSSFLYIFFGGRSNCFSGLSHDPCEFYRLGGVKMS